MIPQSPDNDCEFTPEAVLMSFETELVMALCHEPAAAAFGLAGLPKLPRRNPAVCDGNGGTWHTPRFLLAGFPKAGSDKLWAQIHKHPLVKRKTHAKEMHLFDDLPYSWAIGAAPFDVMWRTEAFDNHPTQRFRNLLPANLSVDEICGDGTPWYAPYLDAQRIVMRVQRWSPAAQLIIVLRSPVRALWSLNCMFQRDFPAQGNASDRFDADVRRLPLLDSRASCRVACEREQRRRPVYDWDGLPMPRELIWAYAERLRVWRAGFERRRFLLLRNDEVGSAVSLGRVHRFLGLDALEGDTNAQDLVNVASGGDDGPLQCGRSEIMPGAEALLDALVVYFGSAVLADTKLSAAMPNPWPEAEVQALVTHGWVDHAFIAPWVEDARQLARAVDAGKYPRAAHTGECLS